MVKRLIYFPVFIVALTIYLCQHLGLPLHWLVNNYVNDFLCLPLVLGTLSFFIRYLKKDKNFQFPLVFVLILASYYSFFFEYYLPKVSQRYTADWIDVVLYFAGAMLFFLVEKQVNRKCLT